jgi:hypothetical protein
MHCWNKDQNNVSKKKIVVWQRLQEVFSKKITYNMLRS